MIQIQYLLVSLGLWIASLGGWTPPECSRAHLDVPADLAARIGDLAALQEVPGLSGEAKRHQVYARLIKDFPETPRKSLALAIEVVLSGR